jgi:hypothetical protein
MTQVIILNLAVTEEVYSVNFIQMRNYSIALKLMPFKKVVYTRTSSSNPGKLPFSACEDENVLKFKFDTVGMSRCLRVHLYLYPKLKTTPLTFEASLVSIQHSDSYVIGSTKPALVDVTFGLTPNSPSTILMFSNIGVC